MSEELKKNINPSNTTYLGEIHDPQNVKISKIFSMSDIFCIPGHVGLGLNQAMYWGLPTVTEKGKQPPEFITLSMAGMDSLWRKMMWDALKQESCN